MTRRLSLLVPLVVLLAACGSPTGHGGADGGAGDGGGAAVTLKLAPADATLSTVDGQVPSQAYTLTAVHPDGTTEDVTADAAFGLADGSLGSFVKATLTATGTAAGTTSVEATWQGHQATATVHFAVVRHDLGSGVDPSIPGAISGATADPADAPTVVYPSPKTLFPTNLSAFEVHWTGPAAVKDYAVNLKGPGVDLTRYVTADPSGKNYASFDAGTWALVGTAAAGATVTVTVTGLDPVAGTTGEDHLDVAVARTRLDGGVYYWAAKSADGSPEGIWRHDQDQPGSAAAPYFTTNDLGGTGHTCVACHVLSPDGTKMAVTFDGGNGPSTLVDVATKTAIIDATDHFHWNFAAFTPDGAKLLGSFNGALTLYDASNGGTLGTVTTPGYGTQPQFSPNGDAVVYVSPTSPTSDWKFTGGRIVLQPYDAAAGTFGTAKIIHQHAGFNDYYPAFSPDGTWLLFDESTEDAYDDASAQLYALPADGSGPAIRLDQANVKGGLTNSWPRWAPFAATATGPDGRAERFYWFTFSSKRAFGVRMAAGRPRIWVAPFFPDRAAAGQPPTLPAFRLPDQSLQSNDHIAQWTQRVVLPIH